MSAALGFTLVELPPVLGLNEAAPLCAQLRALRGQPLMVEASHVERIGGLCLQVLLSARKTWAFDGIPMAIANSSSAFKEAVALLGASSITT
jgi:chemotaxis protein CheX